MKRQHRSIHSRFSKEHVSLGVVLLVLVLAAGSMVLGSCSSNGKDSSAKTAQGQQLYTCSMHPEIIRSEPGNCPICGMKLTPIKESTTAASSGDAAGEKEILYYKDPMHPWYTSDKPGKAPDCGMDLVPVYRGEEHAAGVVRIDPAVEQNINVKIGTVKEGPLSTTIVTSGHIGVAEPNQSIINTKIAGWVERLYIDYMGQSVRQGQKLMEIYSPEFVAAEQELITALEYNDRVSGSRFADAAGSGEALIANARRKLQLWDISDSQIEHIASTRRVNRTITLFAPSNGVVLGKNVIQGQRIEVGQTLLEIADLSTVWLHADLYDFELANVRVGQKAVMTLPYVPGRTFTGRIAFIDPTLDPTARTGRVRIDFPNPKMELKPEMFAEVKILGDPIDSAITVPEQAVIRGGTRDVVIVSLGGGRFEPREVTLGIASEGAYQVIKGLEAGERIVTSAQFLIDSESNLRAALDAMTGGRNSEPEKIDSRAPVPSAKNQK